MWRQFDYHNILLGFILALPLTLLPTPRFDGLVNIWSVDLVCLFHGGPNGSIPDFAAHVTEACNRRLTMSNPGCHLPGGSISDDGRGCENFDSRLEPLNDLVHRWLASLDRCSFEEGFQKSLKTFMMKLVLLLSRQSLLLLLYFVIFDEKGPSISESLFRKQ